MVQQENMEMYSKAQKGAHREWKDAEVAWKLEQRRNDDTRDEAVVSFNDSVEGLAIIAKEAKRAEQFAKKKAAHEASCDEDRLEIVKSRHLREEIESGIQTLVAWTRAEMSWELAHLQSDQVQNPQSFEHTLEGRRNMAQHVSEMTVALEEARNREEACKAEDLEAVRTEHLGALIEANGLFAKEFEEAQSAWELTRYRVDQDETLGSFEESVQGWLIRQEHGGILETARKEMRDREAYWESFGPPLLVERLKRQHALEEKEVSDRLATAWKEAEAAWDLEHSTPTTDEVPVVPPVPSSTQKPEENAFEAPQDRLPQISSPTPIPRTDSTQPPQAQQPAQFYVWPPTGVTLEETRSPTFISSRKVANILRQPFTNRVEILQTMHGNWWGYLLVPAPDTKLRNLLTQVYHEQAVFDRIPVIGHRSKFWAEEILGLTLQFDLNRNRAERLFDRDVFGSMRERVMGTYVVEKFEDSLAGLRFWEDVALRPQEMFDVYWERILQIKAAGGEGSIERIWEARGEWRAARMRFEKDLGGSWRAAKGKWELEMNGSCTENISGRTPEREVVEEAVGQDDSSDEEL